MTPPFSPHPLCQDAESVALIANGAIHDYNFISSLIRNYDRYVAVDGGLLHCRAMGLVPHLIIGDLDSIPSEILNFYPLVPTKIFPIDKDEADMELAIRAVNASNIKKIGIFGAMEKRTDHALANLHLLNRFPEKTLIETELETILPIKGKKHFSCYPGQEISLIPIGISAVGVTTKGLKWELQNKTLDKNFISLSNICLGSKFEISVEDGDLLCCILR